MGRFDVRWQIVPEDDGAWEIGLSELLLIIDYCTGEHAQIEKRVINHVFPVYSRIKITSSSPVTASQLFGVL